MQTIYACSHCAKSTLHRQALGAGSDQNSEVLQKLVDVSSRLLQRNEARRLGRTFLETLREKQAARARVTNDPLAASGQLRAASSLAASGCFLW